METPAHAVCALKEARSKIPPAFWIFILTFSIRILALGKLSNSPYFAPDAGDMKFYNDWALRILHGHFTDGRAFYGLPGYAYLLAAIYKCTGFNPFAVGLLQSGADALTSVLIWKIARLAFIEKKSAVSGGAFIGFTAAIGWTFFQPAQTFSIILMPTSWMIAAFWFCVWRAMKLDTDSVWKPWLALGLLIGFVANMIATILFLIPLFLAAAILAFRREKDAKLRFAKTACSFAVLIAAVFAGTAPCWIHNYFIAHEPVLLSAHSGVNFYIGNSPGANGYPKIPPGMRAGQEGMLKDSITMAEAAAGHPLQRAEVSRFWSAKAGDYIHAHPRDWLLLMCAKFKNFWNAYQYDDLSIITLFARAGILLPGPRFGVVSALGLAGMCLAIAQVPRSRWIAAAILLHMAALMPVFVTERYRMAAVPGLLMMAAFGLWKLWQDFAESNWSECGKYLALSAVAAIFVSWPERDPGLWALDYLNTGIHELSAGEIDRAQQHLETAYAYVPENSEINFGLGNVWWQRRDLIIAQALGNPFLFSPNLPAWMQDRNNITKYYQRAYANPKHGAVRNNLAVLAIQEGNLKLASELLEQALAIDADDAKTHYLLAQTDLQIGQLEAARTHINEALRLKPHQPAFETLAAEIAAKSTDHE